MACAWTLAMGESMKFNPKDSLFYDSGSDEESTDKMSDDESCGEPTA